MTIKSRDKYRERIRDLIEQERRSSCGPESRVAYGNFHRFRFQKLLEVCQRYAPDRSAQVLDVGRSEFTALLAEYYGNVTTIGFELDDDDGGHRETAPLSNVPHVVFDLNRSADVDAWPEMPQAFDLIVYSEAIEHIYSAPEFSMLMLSWLLKENGKIIVSTPNAAKLGNRRRLLRGINPFERLRYCQSNPGHFREYTADELKEMAIAADLHCVQVESLDFYRRGRQRRFQNLRDSLIAVYGHGHVEAP